MLSKKEFSNLSLTLKQSDVVQIGDDVFVYIKKLGNSKSLIVIKAPRNLRIKRLGKIDNESKETI